MPTAVARERRGKDFDPDIGDGYLARRERPDFWWSGKSESVKDDVLGIRPESRYEASAEDHLDNMCEVIADFIDIKSPFTWGHSKAVSAAAAGIAGSLGLTEVEAARLRRSALVHDLGKVTVPCSAMEKEDGHSADEWERIRLHAYYTERILSKVEPLQELGADAAKHHEWVDGGGYHLQLKGDQTSLSQRVLALCDAYAALTDTGDSRMPPEKALVQLKESVGSRFDPEAYEGLVAHVQGEPLSPPARLV